MQLVLDKDLKERITKRFERYSFEVGILEEKTHKDAAIGKRGLKGKDVLSTYAGGPIRKTARSSIGQSMSAVSKSFREHLGINYLTAPFKKKSSDIVKFSTSFFKMAIGADKLPRSSDMRRCQNLLQAIVRNPILRGDYGHNSTITKKIKGFDRLGIDTAQLFKAIKARAFVKSHV